MSVRNILMAAGGSADDKLYVDDVFSAYTYTGNGSTQTINNGIDLAGKGGMVWLKARDLGNGHMLYDTIRGGNQYLSANTTSAQIDRTPSITSWNQNGFSVAGNDGNISYPGYNYISWTFRKAPKFFDVVTYTGNGANRTIPHALGQEVGMMLVKRTDGDADWQVYHRSLANTEYLVLNTSAAKATGATRWNSTTATTSNISLGADATVNASGGAYVAYLFAHNAGADGIVQCGSFTTDGVGVSASINLGWESQYLMVKRTNAADDWRVFDASRGFGKPTYNNKTLYPNLSNAEGDPSVGVEPEATGFKANGLSASSVYIYLAIRRPNKPPTTGTQVYNAIARNGTGAAATVTGVGFAPDSLWFKERTGGFGRPATFDRLRGPNVALGIISFQTDTAYGDPLTSFDMDGFSVGVGNAWGGTNYASADFITHTLKRAPGVFDVVCDTGTGVAHTIAHNLATVPELIIRKCRSAEADWQVYAAGIANTEKLVLNSNVAKATDTSTWNSTTPTSSVFTVGTGAAVNTSAATYATYLFATKLGISKVFSYTGNGSNQTINCGFTTGARFVLIKRTNSAGDWYVWDTVRGIVAGNDPHLSLNTAVEEDTTDDSIDPGTSGFVVNQISATNINVNGATYIGLAFA